jgi:hypothetical protein
VLVDSVNVCDTDSSSHGTFPIVCHVLYMHNIFGVDFSSIILNCLLLY